jgi:hypothetical protein
VNTRTDRQLKAAAVLACAAVGMALAQRTMEAEAALGLKPVHIALVGTVTSAAVARWA